MRLNFALISSFLFASAVLADRNLEHRSELLERHEPATASNVFYKAGGNVTLDNGTIQKASAVLVVPTMAHELDAGVLISVNIGGNGPSCGHRFSAGIAIHVPEGKQPTYMAYCHVVSNDGTIETLFEAPVSPGLRLKVELSISKGSGTAEVIEFPMGFFHKTATTQRSICRQNAQWLTVPHPYWTPPATYGTVTFESPVAYDDDENELWAMKGEIFNMVDNYNHVLTNVVAKDDSITITPLSTK